MRHQSQHLMRVIIFVSLFLIPCLLATATAQHADSPSANIYLGYQIVRFYPNSESEMHLLMSFINQHQDSVDVFHKSHLPNDPWVIFLSPAALATDEYKQMQRSLKHQVVSRSVEKDIQRERLRNGAASQRNRLRRRRRSAGVQPIRDEMLKDHQHYRNFNQVWEWLERKVKENLPATLSIIGHTLEGRPMLLLKIAQGCCKPIIWIDGGIHAREWVAPATALMLIDFLLENTPQSRQLLEKYHFYILPVMNPDGYEYTHFYGRYWRKNRSPVAGSSCIGVDLNRNFPYEWGGGGSSDNPCSPTFRGVHGASELETQAVTSILFELKNNVKLFITLHSYGQYIMPPYGFMAKQYPRLYRQTMAMSHKINSFIHRKYGQYYMIGSSADVMCEDFLLGLNNSAAGGSSDYAAGAINISHVVTIELPDRGRYGFLLPPSKIVNVGQQMWDLLTEFVNLMPSYD